MRTPIAAALAAFLMLALGASARAQEECSWELVVAPVTDPVAYLNDVGAIDGDDAWAVGSRSDGGEFSPHQTLALQWDGSEWTVATTQDVPKRASIFMAVAATSTDDVWAVGSASFGGARFEGRRPPPARTLIEHYDGSSWTIVPSPNVGRRDNRLSDVFALGPDDIWASGQRENRRGVSKSLVLHYDGAAWQVVPSGNRRRMSRVLYGITATSPTDVWAVGVWSRPRTRSRPLALHYDGETWQLVPVPRPLGSVSPLLADAVALTPTDVWAVGQNFVPNASETLTEHFDGIAWSIVDSPNPAGTGINDFHSLLGVDATATDDVWAVGSYFSPEDRPRGTSGLAMHWDSARVWEVFELPRIGIGDQLVAVDARASDDVWAVGSSYPNESGTSFAPPSDPLILRYSC